MQGLLTPVELVGAARGPGALIFEGQFALSSSPGPRGGSRTYLERCGTHLHQLIKASDAGQAVGPLAANRHAIVWQPTQGSLNLKFLPSRRRFRILLPRAAAPVVSDLALTDNHLYVLDETNWLWITRCQPSHRSLTAAEPAVVTGGQSSAAGGMGSRF